MTIMKLGLGSAIVLSFAACTMGCSLEPESRTTSEREPAGDRIADNASVAAPVTPDEVLDPRDGTARFEPSDYFATEGPFRLFGIEAGEGDANRADPGRSTRSAIIADARGWSTRAYREGDAIGRGMRVARVDEQSVTLHGARGEVVLAAGANVQLRIVRHRLDVVAKPLGRHRYALDTNAARAAQAAQPILPSHETHELYGISMLKLGPVAQGSLFAEADFREGDLVAAVDGAAVGEGTLDDIARALTDGRPSVTVRVYRGGVPMERSFATKSR